MDPNSDGNSLRPTLRALDNVVGPRLSYAVLADYVAGVGGRLSRGTLAELRRVGSTRVPLWATVRTFVLACLAYADDRAIVVPDPLRDLRHWQHLHQECRAGGGNVVGGSVPGAVVQARDIHGDVRLTVGAAAVRSAYREQVARIAPESLFDRGAELADLADWCVRPDVVPAYLWWRAPAWAGKSALLSWFVLHPPPGVRVVSFFVTARLSGQSDKRAFAEVVLEQLAEMCGQPLPELLTDATREAHLLAMLAEAADGCRQRGERLVLVVDGLDEDRGVTTGPGAHSIAALLPERPAGDMRVVVASRPDPPIPADVPQRHPLRDQGIVRGLRRSEHADVVRQDAQRELNQLLHGTPAEQDLLGLITAAGGGLSGLDLAELTGASEWEIEELLCAVSGRTFNRRAASWGPPTSPPVYLLAHEQLQQDATRMLGVARLTGYRGRLHTWAAGYQERDWPIDAPEYLLRGYFRLLRETNEVAQLVACALDRARHERMLDLTGGDTAALAEITVTQDIVHDQTERDLLALARLAIYRGELLDRNFLIPAGLPEAWARLGHHARAEALARMLPDPAQQARALAAVERVVTGREPATARTVVKSGGPGQVVSSRSFRTGRQPYHGQTDHQRKVTREDVQAAISAGDLAWAERLAHRVRRPTLQRQALLAVVRAVAAQDTAWAERITRAMRNPRWRAQALTELVVPVANAGDHARAEQLATEAETLARIATPRHQPEVMAQVARAMVAAGDPAGAERLARTIDGPREQARALVFLVSALATSGDFDRAEALADTLTDPAWQAAALIYMMRAIANVRQAAVVLDVVSPSPERDRLLAGLVSADSGNVEALLAAVDGADVGVAGYPRLGAVVQATIGAVPSVHERDRLLVGLVSADPGNAEALLAAIGGAHARQVALVGLVTVLASGDVWRAHGLAMTIADVELREQALVAVVGALARAGDVGTAEEIGQALTEPRWRVRALIELGRLGEAAAACDAVGYTDRRAQTQADVVAAMAASGDVDRAEMVADSIRVARWRMRALATVVGAVGDLDRANGIARRITDPDLHASALAGLARVLDPADGRRLLGQVLFAGRWTATLRSLATIQPAVVLAIGADFLAAGLA